MEAFDFNEKFDIGRQGEILIAKHFGWKRLKGKGPDLLTQKGNFVELKTDTYSIRQTTNFFMERYSDIKLRTDGGPWKAYKDKSVIFLYLYWPDKYLYIFHTIDLLKFLCRNKEKFIKKRIKNKSWITGGYLVPRFKLKNLSKGKSI